MSEGRKAFIAGKYDQAKTSLTAAADLVKNTPATDGRYAISLGELAHVHLILFDAKQAGDLYKKAFDHIGRDTPSDQLAWAMIILDRIDYMLVIGDRSPKHALSDRAYSLIAETKGTDSPEMAAYWARLVAINMTASAPAMAWDQINKAREMVRNAGPEHAETTAKVLHYYGKLLLVRHEHEQAITQYEAAHKILVNKYGSDHEITLNTAAALAEEYTRLERFKDAKPHVVFAAKSMQRLAGKQQPSSANLATIAGTVSHRLGDFAQAEQWYRDALEYYRNAPASAGQLPASHACIGLMEVLHENRKFAEIPAVAKLGLELAERFEPLAGRRGQFFQITDHLHRWNMNEDAAVMAEKAMPLLTYKLPPGFTRRQRVNQGPWIELGKMKFEPAAPLTATEAGWAELLSIYHDKAGNQAKASEWADVALRKREQAVVELGGDAAAGHVAAGIIALDRFDFTEAMAELDKAWQWRMRDRLSLLAVGTAEERGDRLRRDGRLAHLMLSAAWHGRSSLPDAHKIAANVALTYKAPDHELIGLERELGNDADPQLRKHLNDLAAARRELAMLLLAEKDIATAANESTKIAVLRSQIMTLEKAIALHSPIITRQRREMSAHWKQIAQALPADTVLIDYVRFADQLASPASEKIWLAAILHQRDKEPTMVIVGQVQRGGISGYDPVTPADLMTQFGTQAIKVSTRHPYNDYFRADGGRHYTSWVLGQLWPHIRGIRRWIICPDAGLGAVPIWLIPQLGSDRLVIDDYEVSTVASARSILDFARPRTPAGDALIVADADYDADLPAHASRRPAFIRESVKDLTWSPLPGTRIEAAAVSKLLDAAKIKTTVLTREHATKSAVLDARSPRILHIASHGYFFPQARMYLLSDPFRKYTVLADELGVVHPDPLEPLNAQLYSGVVLSGANKGEQGLLTAYELAGMDLSGTELVVLSACDTGRGAEVAGAGVNGLQRAIMKAGARTVVMSLWPVPDRETALLMEMFYKHLLAGQKPAAALREASLELRKHLIQTTGKDDPVAWGAFVVHGNPD